MIVLSCLRTAPDDIRRSLQAFLFTLIMEMKYIINALTNGASAVTPMSDQPYSRSGGVKDTFENTGG